MQKSLAYSDIDQNHIKCSIGERHYLYCFVRSKDELNGIQLPHPQKDLFIQYINDYVITTNPDSIKYIPFLKKEMYERILTRSLARYGELLIDPSQIDQMHPKFYLSLYHIFSNMRASNTIPSPASSPRQSNSTSENSIDE